ncbi:molybdopterin-dependent oxidoreductase [Phyllobacterium sp. SB3]|uniref:molybdopterin-dependent oxidoreductase n=1 Tax=Phyllobacterium sp. SB3 TaxID=3156073 RepID=UPI0032AE9D8C
MSLRRLFVFLTLLVLSVSSAGAGSLPKPTGKPILVVSGNITNKNNESSAEFDRAMLEGIGLQTIETTTPWYESRMRFEGVPFDKLMELLGATGTKVTAVALNDYVTTIPMEDFKKFKVVLAMKRNGNYMPVRDKGPLFIVYPYDSDPQLQTQTYYTRSAWQVAKLIVE